MNPLSVVGHCLPMYTNVKLSVWPHRHLSFCHSNCMPGSHFKFSLLRLICIGLISVHSVCMYYYVIITFSVRLWILSSLTLCPKYSFFERPWVGEKKPVWKYCGKKDKMLVTRIFSLSSQCRVSIGDDPLNSVLQDLFDNSVWHQMLWILECLKLSAGKV